MTDDRSQADRILVAQLTGEARFRARWRQLSADEERAAAAALRELAGGRADLLAEVAGLLEGASEGELEEPLARQAAVLCWLAGADPEAVPAWVAEGRRRRDAARLPPFSGRAGGLPLARFIEIRHRVVARRGARIWPGRKATIRPPCARSGKRSASSSQPPGSGSQTPPIWLGGQLTRS